MSRENQLVELVTQDGSAAGETATVAQAHALPGRLHRAFSVMVVGPDGRLLLQRRADVKTRFPGLWANTCCGHPAPGSDLAESVGRRLADELGITGIRLRPSGAFVYRAADDDQGYVEHEYDHVFLGFSATTEPPPAPDPREVADWTWAQPDALRNDLESSRPGGRTQYVPWLPRVLELIGRR